jgi:hypothetical protein
MRPLLVRRQTFPESGFFRFFPPCEPSAASRRCRVLTCLPCTGKVLPRVKTNNPAIDGGDRRSLWPLPVDRGRRLIVQRWLDPRAGVTRKVTLPAVPRVRYAAISLAIDLLLLHPAPSPFPTHGIEAAPTSIQADAHPRGSQRVGTGQARALGPWIRGEDGRLRPDQRALQG